MSIQIAFKDQEISFNRRRYSINTSYNRIAFRDMVRHILHPAHQALLRILSPRDAEPIAVAKSVSQKWSTCNSRWRSNDVAWSSTTFRKISGLLDPRIGRGMLNTFHVQVPIARWPMDHLFHSSLLCASSKATINCSDHFPLYTSLAYTPSQVTVQE
jgi:hypothetical protein